MDHIHVVAPEPPKPEMAPFTAEKIEKIDENLYRFEKLSFINDESKDTVYLPGKHFLGTYNNYYWHFIHEDLSYYEATKLQIPDLSLSLIDFFGVMQDEKAVLPSNQGKYPYIDFFLKLYPQSVYINRQKSNVVFEEAYYVLSGSDLFTDPEFFKAHGELPVFFHEHPGYSDWSPRVWTKRSHYGPVGMDILTKNLKELIKDAPISGTNKIFISRKDVNSRLADLVDVPEYEFLVKERFYRDEFLADYFEKLGYSVVALEDISYEEQLRLFRDATHIAGTVGAGFSKLHMCSPGTKFYELHVIPIYGFDYGYYEEYRDLDYIPIDLRVVEEQRTLTTDEMLEVLSRYEF